MPTLNFMVPPSAPFRTLLLALLPSWVPTAASAQVLSWGLSIGGPGYEEARGIAVADNGNVYITGEFEATVEFEQGEPASALTSEGFSDAYLAWYANSGAFVNAISFAGTDKSQGYGVAIAPDGTVYVTGIFTGTVDLDPGPGTELYTSGGAYDVYLCALSPHGQLIWADVIGGPGNEESRSVVTDADGNAYIVGEINGDFDADPGPGITTVHGLGSFDAFVAKYAPGGSLVWAQALGGPGDDRAYDLAARPDGEVVVTGYFADTIDLDPGTGTANITAFNQWSDAFLASYGPQGNFLWGEGMGGMGTDSGRGVALDSLGNAVVTGRFAKTAWFGDNQPQDSLVCTGPVGDADIFLAKYDPNGQFIWAKGIGGDQENMPRGDATDRHGNIFVAGRTRATIDFDPGPGTAWATANGEFDLFLAKYDPQGNYLWGFTAGSSYHARGLNVTTDALGSAYLTGWTTFDVDIDPGPDTFLLVNQGDVDAYLAKYNDQVLQDLTLDIQLDDQPAAAGWKLLDQSDGHTLFSDAGDPDEAGTNVTSIWEVLPGCYRLSVTDADGDGLEPGGYSLSAEGGPLLLANGAFSSESSVTLGEGSCLPMGNASLVDSSCAQQVFGPSDTLYLLPVPEATQYTLWFFDPHGSFSTTLDVAATAFALSNMPPGTPAYLPLNVRVRAWVNGMPTAYGPACGIQFDGSIGIPSAATSGQIQLAPNPASGEWVTLRTTGMAQGAWPLKVLDPLGRTVHRDMLHPVLGRVECRIPLHGLANGTYSVMVQTTSGPWCTSLVVAH